MYKIQLLRVLGYGIREQHGKEEIIKNLIEGNFLEENGGLQNERAP